MLPYSYAIHKSRTTQGDDGANQAVAPTVVSPVRAITLDFMDVLQQFSVHLGSNKINIKR